MVKEPDTDRLRAFGEALNRALAVRKMSQKALGEAVGGLSQAAIGGWVAGDSEPSPARVFKAEEVLGLPAGHLSKILGYLPPDAVSGPGATFEELVAADTLLEDSQKRGLLALYREFTARPPGGRGRPRRPKT